MTDPVFYVVMAIAVIILGLSKGGFAGIGMASTPLVAAFTDPLTAAGLMLPIMLIQDPVAVFLYRRSFCPRLLRVMIPGGLIGVLAAYVLATSVPEWGVKVVLGAVSVIFAGWQLLGLVRRLPGAASAPRYDRLLGGLAGAASGFTSAIAHAGPPPFQIYVMPKGLRKEVYVGTSVIFFAAVNLMKLPSFAALGLFNRETLAVSALYLPLAVASSWAGARLVRHVDADRFRLIITLILLAIGCILLLQGVAEAGLRGGHGSLDRA
ncbi:sulfite exporter TauE/SafE family protein [Pseudodonghicola flavimaris]|uniref:Probable membrane transporter protein n=1 Tax=Pseudodonghicola flavimaris TaxID=3050036 RepID=A0ABT7F199_9RHOB|nr:sulfite exporter TauE/SafE family protein [Pseudodonghicola flavimaris]MDK3018388.1 sulfite exporter TauE/SafE family protein [Pseudodonghicola flavimaris]